MNVDLTVPVIISAVSGLLVIAAAWGGVRASMKKLNSMPETVTRIDTRLSTVEANVNKIADNQERIREEQIEHRMIMKAVHRRLDSEDD